MNDDIGAQHPLPSDPSSFSEVPAGQHLTLGRMAEILRASGCVVYASKAAIERLPEAFITSNSGDGKYYVKIAVKSMADLYKWHDAAIIAARGPDVEPYAWQYAKSNGDDTWSVHIDRLAQKPAVHENFEPKALYLAGSLPYVAGPSEAEIEDAHQEGYNEGYEEGKSEWRGVKAQLWNAMQQWLTLRHGLVDMTGEGYTVSDLLNGLAEVEAENKRLRALSATPSPIEDVAEPSELTFSDLRQANVARQQHWGGTDNWTLADWSNALAGEVGEACNVVKKIRRPELGTVGNAADLPTYHAQLESEIGDVLIYLDLLALKVGVTLDHCVSRAFNEKSEKLDMPVLLAARRVRPSPVEDARLKDGRADGVGAGMAIAAGIIVCTWGDEVQATEILNAGGIETEAKLRAAGVDDYDIEILRPVLDQIAEHAASRALQSQRKG